MGDYLIVLRACLPGKINYLEVCDNSKEARRRQRGELAVTVPAIVGSDAGSSLSFPEVQRRGYLRQRPETAVSLSIIIVGEAFQGKR